MGARLVPTTKCVTPYYQYKALASCSPCHASLALIYIKATMIHDNTPHCVFKISELTRHIASQLVLIDGRRSAVNLACACRCLEEPVLSTLWETERSMDTLLRVLPEGTWELRCVGFCYEMVRGLKSSLERSKV